MDTELEGKPMSEDSIPRTEDEDDAELREFALKHADCGFNGGKTVTCDRCKTTYVCTPSSDYYCTPQGDHCCEPCLIGNRPLITIEVP